MLKIRRMAVIVLAALSLIGRASAEEAANEIQRLFVDGCRLQSANGALGAIIEPGKGDIAVTYEPLQGVVYQSPSTSDANQNRFKANVPFGYRVVRWMRRAWDDRGDGEDIPETEEQTEIVVAWDGRWAQVHLILIVEEDPNRTVTFGKSPFGEGEIGHEFGTFDCLAGDRFELNAVPAFDDKYHVELSKFLGWNDGNVQAKRTVVVRSNETYIARFEPSSWKVSFDANGGTVEPTEKTVAYGFKYGVLPTPKWDGHDFKAWSVQEGGQEVSSDSDVGPLGNHTLLAKWVAAQYKIACEIVSLDGGNGTVNGVGDYAWGDAVKLEAKPYVGSLFSGWADGETLNPRQFTAISNVSYQALFTSQYYKVQFEYRNENGIAVRTDVQSVRHGQSATPPDLSLVTNWVGHVFYGWKQDFEKVTESHVGEKSIQASYDSGAYVVRFNNNGGTGKMSDQVFAFDTGKALSKCLFTLVDKVFVGWAKDKDATDPMFADQEVVIGLTAENGAIIDLYAVWTDAPTYTVVFESNGADSGDMAQQVLKNGVGGELASNRFDKVGYLFQGWSTNAEAQTANYTDRQKISAKQDLAEPGATICLWAVWKPIQYTLHLDGNRGEVVAQQPISMTYGVPVDLAEKVSLIDREGYHVDSWSTNSAALPGEGEFSGTTPVVSNLTTVADSDVTLYVIWKEGAEEDNPSSGETNPLFKDQEGAPTVDVGEGPWKIDEEEPPYMWSESEGDFTIHLPGPGTLGFNLVGSVSVKVEDKTIFDEMANGQPYAIPVDKEETLTFSGQPIEKVVKLTDFTWEPKN